MIILALLGSTLMAQSDASLKTLTVSHGELTPGFSPKRLQYAVQVPHRVTELTYTAQPTIGEQEVALNVGRTLVNIEVVAGETKKTYVLKVLREQPTVDWTRVLDKAPWPARDSAGELVFKDRMWLLGGYLPKVVGDVWSSADGKAWERAGDVPSDAGVNIPVNFVHDGRMFVASNKGELFASTDGAAWELVNASPPWAGRYAAGGAHFRGRMWVLGGNRRKHLHNDVWSSADGKEWKQEVEHAPWSPRQLFSNVIVKDDKLWVIGGGITSYEPFRAYRDVWCSEDGRKWEQVTDEAPWAARIWSSYAVYRNRIFLLGGFRGQPVWENRDDVWYTADGKTWKQLKTDNIWSARHELSAYVFQDKLWVVAGNSWPLRNDVWSLHIPGLTFLSQPVIEEYVGTLYRYRAEADFHESAVPLRYRLIEAPDWLSIDADTGVVTGIPAKAGDYPVTIEAADGDKESARQSYTLHVQAL